MQYIQTFAAPHVMLEGDHLWRCRRRLNCLAKLLKDCALMTNWWGAVYIAYTENRVISQ
jgi:hypothetical protein